MCVEIEINLDLVNLTNNSIIVPDKDLVNKGVGEALEVINAKITPDPALEDVKIFAAVDDPKFLLSLITEPKKDK